MVISSKLLVALVAIVAGFVVDGNSVESKIPLNRNEKFINELFILEKFILLT